MLKPPRCRHVEHRKPCIKIDKACIKIKKALVTTVLSTIISSNQGRIYVANEYPTFARNMAIVSRKPMVLRQNYLE